MYCQKRGWTLLASAVVSLISFSYQGEATNISKLQQTEFVPTLESPINHNKNIVYATAFLYAWDKVKEKLHALSNLTNDNTIEFRLLNQSTSYVNTLTDGEYLADAEMSDSIIIAKAFFNMILLFPSKLQKLDNPISFNKTKFQLSACNHMTKKLQNYRNLIL